MKTTKELINELTNFITVIREIENKNNRIRNKDTNEKIDKLIYQIARRTWEI